MYDIISEKHHYNSLVTTFMPTQDNEVATAISNLKTAIAENDIRRLEEVLSKFPLLRSKSVSQKLLANYFKQRNLEKVRQIFDAISNVKSPEMIYAILAAGFSPFDLGAIFKSKGAYKSYVMLTHIIPNLTSEQIQSLKNNDHPVCVYTREVARIPVKWLGVHYDLHSVFNALTTTLPPDNLSKTAPLGYTNALFEHDKLEIDLELLKRILQLIPEKNTNAQCIESINKDIDEFNKYIYELNKPNVESLNEIQSKFHYVSIYTFSAAAFLYFIELQIDNYLATLPEEEVIRLWKDYHDLLKLASILILSTRLLSTLSHAAKYIKALETQHHEIKAIPKLEFEPSELSFDYHAAQQNLIRGIPERFANEFASGQKPASLLFWKQAFDAKRSTDSSIEETSTPKQIKNTRPLLKM